jgi:hypothetical protein
VGARPSIPGSKARIIPAMSEANGSQGQKAGRQSVSLRALFKLHVAANKPLELDFPSGKVVMSVAEMITALKDDEAAERSRNQP